MTSDPILAFEAGGAACLPPLPDEEERGTAESSICLALIPNDRLAERAGFGDAVSRSPVAAERGPTLSRQVFPDRSALPRIRTSPRPMRLKREVEGAALSIHFALIGAE